MKKYLLVALLFVSSVAVAQPPSKIADKFNKVAKSRLKEVTVIKKQLYILDGIITGKRSKAYLDSLNIKDTYLRITFNKTSSKPLAVESLSLRVEDDITFVELEKFIDSNAQRLPGIAGLVKKKKFIITKIKKKPQEPKTTTTVVSVVDTFYVKDVNGEVIDTLYYQFSSAKSTVEPIANSTRNLNVGPETLLLYINDIISKNPALFTGFNYAAFELEMIPPLNVDKKVFRLVFLQFLAEEYGLY